MSKASRLLQILTILSARRLAIRGEVLADMLDVSLRTIYRDIDALRMAGAEIEGEAGVGYVLARNATLPPLSFTEDEVVALLLGSKIVQAQTDFELARAAQRAETKILSVMSDPLKRIAEELPYHAPHISRDDLLRANHGVLRKAVSERRKLEIRYHAKNGQESERIIWPLGLISWIGVWTLVAWCELRGDFRSFRVDLIENIKETREEYPVHEKRNLKEFLADIHQKPADF